MGRSRLEADTAGEGARAECAGAVGGARARDRVRAHTKLAGLLVTCSLEFIAQRFSSLADPAESGRADVRHKASAGDMLALTGRAAANPMSCSQRGGRRARSDGRL